MQYISSADDAAKFTAVLQNLRNLMGALVKTKDTYGQSFWQNAGGSSPISSALKRSDERLDRWEEKRQSTAQEVLGRLRAMPDFETRRYIIIAAFLIFEPSRKDSVLNDPALDSIQKYMQQNVPGITNIKNVQRTYIVDGLLNNWGIEFDNNVNEVPYFQIGIEALLLCALTPLGPQNIDKPSLAFEQLRDIKEMYEGQIVRLRKSAIK